MRETANLRKRDCWFLLQITSPAMQRVGAQIRRAFYYTQTGFTLAELFVVIAVIAILASLLLTFTPLEPPEPSARSLRHRTVNGSVSHNRTFRKRVFLVWRAKLRIQNLGLSFDLDAALPRQDSRGLVGKTFSDGIAAPAIQSRPVRATRERKVRAPQSS